MTRKNLLRGNKLLKVGQKWYQTDKRMFRRIIEIDTVNGGCTYYREDGQIRQCSISAFVFWIDKLGAKTI